MDERTPKKRSHPEDDFTTDVPSPRKAPKESFWPSKRRLEMLDVRTPATLITLKPSEKVREIMVRVVGKRQRKNLLEFTVMDQSGQRTMKALNRATWNQFRTLEIDTVYKVSNFTVNAGWNGGNPEISLGPYSHFERISDRDFPPMPPFNFTPLKDLSSLPDDTRVDVLGIVTKVKDVVNNSVTGVQRLEIYIDDDISKCDLSVIFWRDDASSFAGIKPFNPIIFRDAVKLTYCDEPTLHVKSFTQIWENSSNADARDLYERFEKAALEEGVELIEADEHAGESANE